MVCGVVIYNNFKEKRIEKIELLKEFNKKVTLFDLGFAWYYEHYCKIRDK